ncbi:MAG: hypothetical protein NTX88_00315 [Candidatus Atribacteria bacterium]|nr:hypothetical protein [Candidatus Atribacteria bacterium]
MNKKSGMIVVLLIVLAAGLVFYTQFTIFVVQPIGALPEGKTLIISRLNKTEFIDSADAMCERLQGGVNLLCRGAMLGAVIEKATIYARLPYREWFYQVSTGGKEYDR